MKAAGYPLLLAVVLGFSATPASAQVMPGDPAGNQTIPEKDQSRPQDMPKGEKDGTGRGETLSDKLDASGGGVKPPRGIDPGISKPAPVPEPNSTPVIPPAGTPGGPPGPEPKVVSARLRGRAESLVNIRNLKQSSANQTSSTIELILRVYLDVHEVGALAALLACFAKAAGAGEMLNIHDLKAAYEKTIGHETSNSTIYNLLNCVPAS